MQIILINANNDSSNSSRSCQCSAIAIPVFRIQGLLVQCISLLALPFSVAVVMNSNGISISGARCVASNIAAKVVISTQYSVRRRTLGN